MIRSRPSKKSYQNPSRVEYQPKDAVVRKRNRPRFSPAQIRMQIVLGLSFLLILELCAAALTSPWMYVRTVRVYGLARLTASEVEQVRALADVPPRTNLFRANSRYMESQLGSLPFIAKAQVGKRPFGNLDVTVLPRNPVAMLSDSQQTWELDSAAVPIRSAMPGDSYPLVQLHSVAAVFPGTPIQDDGVAGAVLAIRKSSATIRSKLAKIEVDSNAELCLNMNDGVVVRFGRQDNAAVKLSVLDKVYKEEPEIGVRVESIDLRCPDVPACVPRTAAKPSSKRNIAHTIVDSSKKELPGTAPH